MQTTFLNSAGTVLFVRDDMEQGNWTQEEYSVNATFPYVSGKVIERGQRIAFRDPATNTLEMFEIRNVTNIEPEHYQQLIAEHIVISELSDEHINTTEISSKTAAQALGTVLTGTLWSVGNNTASGTSSVDVSRGSVWQGVTAIMTNWNVYITPRVTVNAAGSITGRYLDIAPAQGTWRGVRLSVQKNITDASVIYDDSEVVTAMYGYGGMVDVPQASTFDTTKELNFADIVWSATSSHPAKPSGQTYIEDPAKTALYGRGNPPRPRFGYYQNGDIKDGNTLLEKTWETLKEASSPKISISGTVTDLYRLGYNDEPLRLHDIVIVEIRETGETFEKEIIKLDVNLLDPTETHPEIGDYIPNIIYINRETDEKAGGGGGGGGRGQTNEDKKIYDTFYDLSANTDELGSWVGMVVGKRVGDTYIKGGEITLSINEDHGTTAKLQADTIYIQGLVDELTAYDLTTATFHSLNTIVADGEAQFNQGIAVEGDVTGITNLDADYATFSDVTTTTITAGGSEHAVSWKSQPVVTSVSISNSHAFLYGDASLNPTGRASGSVVLSTPGTTTINYLGY